MTKKSSIFHRIANLPVVSDFIEWTKKSSLPGFDDVPIYDVFMFLVQELKKDNIVTRANSMAFSFFLALFPSIIFLFTLIPLMPFSEDYLQMFEQSIAGVLPMNAEQFLLDLITDLMSIPRGGLLSLGFILAFIFTSNGMNAMIRGFNKSYEISYFSRNFVKQQLVSLKLTSLLILLFLASIFLIVGGKLFINYLMSLLEMGGTGKLGFQILRWLVVVFLFYSGISIIYRYGPALKQKFKFITPGATMATLFSILASLLFAAFVNNFGTYNKIYGSIGALIVIMLWMQFNAFILLAGYELNASIAVNRDLKRQAQPK